MNKQKTIDIGTRREPFFDDYLIESMDGAALELHHPERREIALECDAPWESDIVGFNSVVQEGERVRLYYRASTDRARTEDFQSIAVAESHDRGISFERPNFGLVEYGGSKSNNIIVSGEMPIAPPAFLDTNPDCPDDQRYKGLCSKWRKLYAMCSADGVTWRLMQDDPIEMSGTFDTINTAFWDSRIGEYRSFTRFFRDADFDSVETDLLGAENTAVRSIQSSRSPDFLQWNEPVAHTYHDSALNTQLYTNATIPCPGAEHIYLSFPNRYVQHRVPDPNHLQPGVNDALFMCSRDGSNWTRYLDAWVRPGLDPLNWTDRNNYPTWGIVETSESEWSMYISEHYRHPGIPGRLRRLSIRPFGFVSIHSDSNGGTMITKPFLFSGKELEINFSTSAAGGITIGVLDNEGQTADGFTNNDMEELYGDELGRIAKWKGGRGLAEAVNGNSKQPIRLRFELRDADVYSISAV